MIAHCDGAYETPDRRERTYFTLHLYLNSARDPTQLMLPDKESSEECKGIQSGLVGGSTPFFARNMKDRLDVNPKAGRVLLFQHGHLLHSGDDVVQGIKYTMRSDLLYAIEKPLP